MPVLVCSCSYRLIIMCILQIVSKSKTNWFAKRFSSVENQNDLELDFNVFFFVDSCCCCIVLDNPNDATLASLSVLRYSRWRPRWPSDRL